MSLLVGQTVMRVATPDSGYTGPQVAVAMALFGGIIAIAIGMVRLGILVDFIPGKYHHFTESHGSSKSNLLFFPLYLDTNRTCYCWIYVWFCHHYCHWPIP